MFHSNFFIWLFVWFVLLGLLVWAKGLNHTNFAFDFFCVICRSNCLSVGMGQITQVPNRQILFVMIPPRRCFTLNIFSSGIFDGHHRYNREKTRTKHSYKVKKGKQTKTWHINKCKSWDAKLILKNWYENDNFECVL